LPGGPSPSTAAPRPSRSTARSTSRPWGRWRRGFAALDLRAVDTIEIDTTEATVIDVRGVAMLVDLYRQASARGALPPGRVDPGARPLEML
jgi:hypothetical protein